MEEGPYHVDSCTVYWAFIAVSGVLCVAGAQLLANVSGQESAQANGYCEVLINTSLVCNTNGELLLAASFEVFMKPTYCIGVTDEYTGPENTMALTSGLSIPDKDCNHALFWRSNDR